MLLRAAPNTDQARPRQLGRLRRFGMRRAGWIEAFTLLVVYEIYEWVRAKVQGPRGPSLHHANQVVHLERWLGIFQEARIQSWFLSNHKLIEFWDVWYGTIHFVIPPLTLWLLYRRFPPRYRLCRDILASATLLGLACFWLWPFAPPRLLSSHYHFVDTAKTIGGMGPADQGSMQDDNAFAAMPSLHIAWSAWCAIVLVPILSTWWTKALAILYPFVTLGAVVITANHFILDGVGGLLALAVGWPVAVTVDRWLRPRWAHWLRPRLS
jgi:hypothetical protein